MKPAGPGRVSAGISLVELLLVVAMIGILAAIAVPMLGGLLPGTKKGVADDTVALLNRGVRWYEQVGQEITQAAAVGSADEVAVAGVLMARDAGLPGSPFLEGSFEVVPTADTSQYRAVWMGRHFEVAEPGEAGAGLLVVE